ncbi:MAG TPA: hypothetical protein PKD00_04980 [Burkholderiales bacterium]|nr:hypothetical protein [Burkholderiales bacterium]
MNIYTHILNIDVHSYKGNLQGKKGEKVMILKVDADNCIVEDTKGNRFIVRRECLTIVNNQNNANQ